MNANICAITEGEREGPGKLLRVESCLPFPDVQSFIVCTL